jgi:hypothetical protein
MLKDEFAVETWIRSEERNVVHITGVGVLQGANSQHRLYAEADKILQSRVLWRSIA